MESIPCFDGVSIIEQARQYPPMGLWADVFEKADSALERISEKLEPRGVFYPNPNNLLFHAFHICPLENVKVVIIGEAPHANEDDAWGLAFSTPPNRKRKPSVTTIFDELKREYEDFDPPFHGCLTSWSTQGVLLLNSCLTYYPDDPLTVTERKIFMPFMKYVIEAINEVNKDCVYLLWGNDARRFGIFTKGKKTLTTVDPTPFAGGKFIGCGHFKETNEYLVSKGMKPIDWCDL